MDQNITRNIFWPIKEVIDQFQALHRSVSPIDTRIVFLKREQNLPDILRKLTKIFGRIQKYICNFDQFDLITALSKITPQHTVKGLVTCLFTLVKLDFAKYIDNPLALGAHWKCTRHIGTSKYILAHA